MPRPVVPTSVPRTPLCDRPGLPQSVRGTVHRLSRELPVDRRTIRSVALHCHTDLTSGNAPPAALDELVERLARLRLTDALRGRPNQR
ncbi:hypothetical protein [Nakamurella endophytica]|uniref:hypothetical protein n=1 Tax=Nakamurella endophytica TaxID=1748367 RepID=UPI00166CB8B5|nr:hypothetical protein [Nakamurella endophytica]